MQIKRQNERRSISRSASRALDILEHVAEVGGPFRAIDIVRRFDMHPATANQLLKTLVESSHLIFDFRSKTYVPSPRLVAFGAWMMRTYSPTEPIRDLLQEVHSSTGGIVTLTTGNGLFMQILELAEGASFLEGERGMRVPLFESVAIGFAYLASLDDAEIEHLAERARVPRADLPRILGRVSSARHHGFIDGVSYDRSFASIAMPLSPRSATAPMVLAIAGETEHIKSNQKDFRKLMQNAASLWEGAAA